MMDSFRFGLPSFAFVAAAACLVSCSKDSPSSADSQNTNSQPINLALSGPIQETWFHENATAAGLNFRHHSGAYGEYYIPEMMGGGVGLLDYNNDGFLDIYCVQSGSLKPGEKNLPGNQLFRNRGDATYEDVTESAGVGDTGYGMGCACVDYDNDGDTDIYVTNLGANVLYRNNGDGTFTDTTADAGVGDANWGTSAAFFDYDNDGNLDLVVANYIHWSREQEVECYSRGGKRDYCSPMNYQAPAMDSLYRNRGDGTFENTTVSAGLNQAYGNGLGVVCADFTGDDQPDIYIANDAMPNQLWVNQGNGSFKDEALIRGCAVNYLGIPEAGMGVVAVDIQNDGWLDLFVTHLEGEANRLYINKDVLFADTVTPKGPGTPSWPHTGFGVGFADFNHDTLLDLYVANGNVKFGAQQYDPADPYAEPNQLLRGTEEGAFEEVHQAGTQPKLIATSRGLATGDLDNDGDIDLVIINRDGPAHLLRNETAKKGNWIMFNVVNAHGSPAIGAVLRIKTLNSEYVKTVQPNQGYCSSNDPRVHCTLGQAQEVSQVKVHWPDGTEETFGPFPAGSIIDLP